MAAVAAVLLIAGCTAETTPTPAPEEDFGLPPLAEPLALDQLERFGAVATMSAGSNCTGTLVDTGVPDGPAYVLTNGHCVGDIGRPAQKTTVSMEWSGTAEFFRAEGNLDSTLTTDVVEIAYSTMRHTDTAIVRLDARLGELEAVGVAPIAIADAEPEEGAAVTNIGVPVQGLTDDQWVLRRSECTLGAQHTVIEFFWLWFGVWSNDCPGIVQGSSGSPLLALDAGGDPEAIVAVVNTTTWAAREGGECWLNRPCEVEDAVARLVPETSYAQSVAGIGRCFDRATGEFALGGECPLPYSDIWAEEGGGSFRGGGLPDAFDRMPAASLVGREAGVVRTAVVPIGDARACTAEATYAGSAPAELPAATEAWERAGTRVAVELPEEEGRFLLCAVRGDAYAAAATVLFAVDRTPPVVPAGASVEDLGAGILVQPHMDPPELTATRFVWGPPGEVDCDDLDAFEPAPFFPLIIDPADLPAVYCVYSKDEAGNPSPVARVDIPAP
ncbi:trypsin-like peptidase domain-containing protein [Microbacterium sp. BWT-B31]|uniref:trypsin-like serine peptidase n=1 Tax=Microbacterium sp. BWT-B31 TaxID=3232072 RepID=UPI0035297C50